MSDLHSYLRQYIGELEKLLAQCEPGNDACLLQAAYQLWGEDDPRYLVLVATQNSLKRGIDVAPKPQEPENDFQRAEKESKGKMQVNKPVNHE
ncbi:MAG: hypothetical protein R3E08_12030 [Thiotrichaceae bacterium]